MVGVLWDRKKCKLHVDYAGMVASAQLLLEHGASLEVEDKAGRTPLLGAAQGGHTNVLELLQVLIMELRDHLNWQAQGDFHW